jgi:hypothetical protein
MEIASKHMQNNKEFSAGRRALAQRLNALVKQSGSMNVHMYMHERARERRREEQ